MWAVVTDKLHSQSITRVADRNLKREQNINYAPGDQVLLVRGKFIDGRMAKEEEPTEGPFTILRREGKEVTKKC